MLSDQEHSFPLSAEIGGSDLQLSSRVERTFMLAQIRVLHSWFACVVDEIKNRSSWPYPMHLLPLLLLPFGHQEAAPLPWLDRRSPLSLA